MEVKTKPRGAGGRVVVADPARVAAGLGEGQGSGRTNGGHRGAVSFGVLAAAIVQRVARADALVEAGFVAGGHGLPLPPQDKPASEEQDDRQRGNGHAESDGIGDEGAHAAPRGSFEGRTSLVAAK